MNGPVGRGEMRTQRWVIVFLQEALGDAYLGHGKERAVQSGAGDAP